MNLVEAARLVEGQAKQYLLEDLRTALTFWHKDQPQRQQLALHALDGMEAALAQLAQLGHRFFLVRDEVGAVPQPFPMMLYRVGAEGQFQDQIVADQAALDAAIADGWQTWVGSASAIGSAGITSSSTSGGK